MLTPASTFLQVEGAASEGITVEGGDHTKAAAALSFKAGAGKKTVRLRE